MASGPPAVDSSITLAQFWQSVFRPVRSRSWQLNTTRAFDTTWNLYVGPQLGSLTLNSISKSTVELHLCKLADAGKGYSTLRGAHRLISSLLLDAVDNDLIPKNPAKKVRIPQCREPIEVRSLTLEEVRLLWDSTSGRDYLMWRLLLLTGLRKGELLALTRTDVQGDVLCIDETVEPGGVREGTKGTKKGERRKIRYAPLPASLKAELDQWLAEHDSHLLFPNLEGRAYRMNSNNIAYVMKRGKAIIPGLTFRQCRTTFATLFEGDLKDVQAILGHATAQFTADRYKKSISDRQAQSVEALDKRVRAKVVEIKKAG
jgi:integrase